MKVAPATSVYGRISLPGDKSISHRAAMIAAIAERESRIHNYSLSADCSATLECLSALGVSITRDGDDVVVDGVGLNGLQLPQGLLECQNSGTTMRLLSGILAGQPFETVLTGDESLSQRPMQRIIEPLTAMGADVTAVGGRPPLTIRGRRPLSAIEHKTPIASAQVKSSILFAGLFADGRTRITEASPARDHTERMLRVFGVPVEADGRSIVISGGGRLLGRNYAVPGDISAAAFFLVAAGCLGGSDLQLPNVGINPTRSAILDVLRTAGVSIELGNSREVCGEPVADIRVTGGIDRSTSAVFICGEQTAALIDELPVLAVLGTQLPGGLEVRDASELRVKESDRIAAIVENVRRMHAGVTEYEDGFRVERSALRGAMVDSFGDHRIAMSMSIAALLAEGETEITGAEYVDVSFPGFFEMLASVVR